MENVFRPLRLSLPLSLSVRSPRNTRLYFSEQSRTKSKTAHIQAFDTWNGYSFQHIKLDLEL